MKRPPHGFSPDNIDRIASAGALANFLPYLTAQVEEMKAAVASKALLRIRDQALTPDVAQQLWLEYAALDALLRKFNTIIKIGETSRERFADALEKETTDGP